jgi:hypothetical protein
MHNRKDDERCLKRSKNIVFRQRETQKKDVMGAKH